MRPITIVCDLDGTLADCRHRQHLALSKDWDGFHELLHLDPPVEVTMRILNHLLTVEVGLYFLTGRPQSTSERTKIWLSEVCHLYEDDDYAGLIMRGTGDFRPDYEIKLEELAFLESEGKIHKESTLILEDRDKVVASMRDAGWTVWQVAEGAF